MYSKIKSRRLYEQIIEQIQRQLLAGTLRPGDQLPSERELAEQFGVSRTAVREAVKALREKGLVVHGAGMQGHYGMDQPGDMKEFDAAIRGFGDMGLEVYITELDMSVLPFPPQSEWGADISIDLELNEQYNPYADGLPADVEERQAARYFKLFKILQANRDAVARVTFWGVNDGDSWKNNWPMRGRTDYPLLFGRDNEPKAVYHRVTELSKTD